MHNLSNRIDNLEQSIKKDISCILDILQNQHQNSQFKIHKPSSSQQSALVPEQTSGFKSFNNTCQQSESNFSFDMISIPENRSIVQRSISQPECDNEKSLFK